MPAGVGVVGAQVDVVHPSYEPRAPAWISRPFLLDETETTVGQWVAMMGADPSQFPSCGPECPVQGITWWSALAFANARSDVDGLQRCYTFPEDCSGAAAEGTLVCPDDADLLVDDHPADCRGWRLPTDSEWEYAVRAMRPLTTPWSEHLSTLNGCEPWYGGEAYLYAWWCGNAVAAWEGCVDVEGRCLGPQPVAGLTPTPWGLFDAMGNVAEWVWDAGTPALDLVSDPLLQPDGSRNRAVRGGSWRSYARGMRAAARPRYAPESRRDDVGVRLARTVHETTD